MSRKTGKTISLKLLEKECSNISLSGHNPILLVTSPEPKSTIASAMLSRALIRSNKNLHTTFVEPVTTVNAINELRTRYESADIIIIGIDIIGTKQIKKGKGYPVLIGGSLESEQKGMSSIGNESMITTAAYALAKTQLNVSPYELQFAAAGALISNNTEKTTKGASEEIVNLAMKEGVLEERKGFRLFGVGLLPLGETLLNSIEPYLPSISGNQKTCDDILRAAEIPILKLQKPLNNLNTSETQRLASQLITMLQPEVITNLLGRDYILTLEGENCPIRYLSGLELAANTSWTRNDLGLLMSVWLGDRGRALRHLIDNQMLHNKEVISSFARLDSGLSIESSSAATIVKIPGVKSEILSDVGRIALNNKTVDPERPIVLDNEESHIIIWPFSKLSIKTALRKLLDKKITAYSKSPQSINIVDSVEFKEIAVQIIAGFSK